MISTKGRYAIRFMIDLGEQPAGTTVPLDKIAERQDISKKYLELIVKMLVSANLVKGSSGKGGGYRLLRQPCDYSVGEILSVTEGSLHTVACLERGAERCPRQDICKTLPMWKKYDSMVLNYFDNVTLQDLIDGTV